MSFEKDKSEKQNPLRMFCLLLSPAMKGPPGEGAFQGESPRRRRRRNRSSGNQGEGPAGSRASRGEVGSALAREASDKAGAARRPGVGRARPGVQITPGARAPETARRRATGVAAEGTVGRGPGPKVPRRQVFECQVIHRPRPPPPTAPAPQACLLNGILSAGVLPFHRQV